MQFKRFTIAASIGLCFLFLPLLSSGQCVGTVSGFLVPNSTDTVGVSFPASGAGSFFANLTAGHSYSIQVTTHDNTTANSTLTAQGPGGCLGGAVAVNETTLVEPAILNLGATAVSGRRVSFTPAASGLYAFNFTTNNAGGHIYTGEIYETTLFNPRWATNQGYLTVYGFQNTTSQAINIVLKATATFGGTGTTTFTAAIPANTQVLVALGPGLTINIPAGQVGFAILTHDGPQGGLTVDAYFTNGVSLVPAVFAPRNSEH